MFLQNGNAVGIVNRIRPDVTHEITYVKILDFVKNSAYRARTEKLFGVDIAYRLIKFRTSVAGDVFVTELIAVIVRIIAVCVRNVAYYS